MDEISDVDRLERDLARTRARMDNRLDQLQDHLTPKQMLNDAFVYFRGGDGADFTKEMIGKAKANPLPIALTGIGIAWMIGSSRTPASRPSVYGADFEAKLLSAEDSVDRSSHSDDDSYAASLDDARGRVVGLTRDASDTAASYAARIRDGVAAVKRHIREASHDLKARTTPVISHIGEQAGDQGVNIQQGTQTMVSSTRDAVNSIVRNPFALGGVAAVVGLVAGALIPTLDEEERALGEVATKVRTAGRDLARDVVDRGGRIANDTLDAVKDSAQAHGLSTDKPIGDIVDDVRSGVLVDDLKGVAQETLQAGKDSVHTHVTGEPSA